MSSDRRLTTIVRTAGGTAAWLVIGALLWFGAVLLTQTLWAPPSGIAIVAAATGLAAGLLVVVSRRSFVLILLSGAIAFAAVYVNLDLPAALSAWLVVTNLGACALYAWVIRRFRDRSTGLGAALPWAVVAAAAAASLRIIPMLVDAIDGGSHASFSLTGTVQLALATVIGLLTVSSAVIALTPWQPLLPIIRTRGRAALISTAAAIVVTAVVLLTPVGAHGHGAEFWIIPMAAIVAAQWPFRITALATVGATLLVATSLSRDLGPFTDPADAEHVITAQVFLIALAITTLSLAAAVEQLQHSRRSARSAVSVQHALYEHLPVPIVLVSVADDTVLGVNDAFRLLSGQSADLAPEACLVDLFALPRTEAELRIAARTDLPIARPDGSTVWVLVTLSDVLRDPESGPSFRVAAFEDVTAGRVSEDLLREQAQRDPLTGLGGRAAFLDALTGLFADRAAHETTSAILVKIDGLRRVNTGAGPELGDIVIRQIAARLRSLAAGVGEAFRVSSSAFALVLAQTDRTRAIDLAEQARIAVAQPVVAAGDHLHVTARCGIVPAVETRTGPVGVLRKAESALERGRRDGLTITVFETADDVLARTTHELEQPLHDAVASGSLLPHFQPIFDIAKDRIVGAEALVRLPGADGTLLPPALFLPLAAELDLMGSITEHMLDRALHTVAAWSALGHDVFVSVNASPSWLDHAALAHIDDCLARHGVAADRLTIEITEGEMLSLASTAVGVLRRLRSRGCRVAIDDFGTGYAGLDAFRRIPADVVKIDQSFVAAVGNGGSDHTMLASMIDLIHRFGKIAVGEGVETHGQLRALRELGCDRVQGYLISRPVPQEEFLRVLRTN